MPSRETAVGHRRQGIRVDCVSQRHRPPERFSAADGRGREACNGGGTTARLWPQTCGVANPGVESLNRFARALHTDPSNAALAAETDAGVKHQVTRARLSLGEAERFDRRHAVGKRHRSSSARPGLNRRVRCAAGTPRWRNRAKPARTLPATWAPRYAASDLDVLDVAPAIWPEKLDLEIGKLHAAIRVGHRVRPNGTFRGRVRRPSLSLLPRPRGTPAVAWRSLPEDHAITRAARPSDPRRSRYAR